MNSSKVLVTGATGVVGRRLVPILLRNGHRVIVLARPSERRQGLERAGATGVLTYHALDAARLIAG